MARKPKIATPKGYVPATGWRDDSGPRAWKSVERRRAEGSVSSVQPYSAGKQGVQYKPSQAATAEYRQMMKKARGKKK